MLLCRCKDVGVGIALLGPHSTLSWSPHNQKATLSARSVVFTFVGEQRCQVMQKKIFSDFHLEPSGSSYLPPVRQGLATVWIADELYCLTLEWAF